MVLNWYSSIKKMRKILMIFDIQTWLWKSIFGAFDTSPSHQFSKFNTFLWVCWFLNKNLSNFFFFFLKLHNPYFHTNAGFGRHSFHKRLFRASVQNCVYRSFQEKLFQNNFVNWRSYLGFCRKVTNSESGFVKNLQE